ncbi:MAG: glutaredoxin family protein [bacterium]
MKKVVMYSTPTCHYCKLAKDFFDEYHIPYEIFNVQSNLEKRKEMIEKSGQMGVPVILIDDIIVNGFNEEELKKLLKIN